MGIAANPVLIIVVVLLAIIISKALKLTGKVIKAIICIGIAYFLVTRFLM